MKNILLSGIVALFTFCMFVSIFCYRKTDNHHPADNYHACYVGEMIEITRQVFEGNGTESDFDQVIQFGRDTRYYPLLRAWLVQEITNTKSQLTSQQKNSVDEARLKEKMVRLERMLRLIDLE